MPLCPVPAPVPNCAAVPGAASVDTLFDQRIDGSGAFCIIPGGLTARCTCGVSGRTGYSDQVWDVISLLFGGAGGFQKVMTEPVTADGFLAWFDGGIAEVARISAGLFRSLRQLRRG